MQDWWTCSPSVTLVTLNSRFSTLVGLTRRLGGLRVDGVSDRFVIVNISANECNGEVFNFQGTWAGFYLQEIQTGLGSSRQRRMPDSG